MNTAQKLKEINENLIKEDLSFLLFFVPTGFDVASYPKKIIFKKDDAEVVFTCVNGVQLNKYVKKNFITVEIMEIFEQITEVEKTYRDDISKIQEHALPYSQKLPALYEQLKKDYWIISGATNQQVVSQLVAEINKSLTDNQSSRPTLKIK